MQLRFGVVNINLVAAGLLWDKCKLSYNLQLVFGMFIVILVKVGVWLYQITIRVWAILNGVVTIVVCVLIFGGLAFH